MPLPWDAVEGQVAIGTDGSFNWYSNGAWHGQPGTPVYIPTTPQDVVDGQVVIGQDGALYWYTDGQWYTAPFVPSTEVNPPQDVVAGQVAIGMSDDTFHWSPEGVQSF
jgi:hypothetical protein